MKKCYRELSRLETFEERFNYLKLGGTVGRETFGYDRYINQNFYSSREWKEARDHVIIRDNGCDLGILDRPIYGKIAIHHLNQVTAQDILERADWIFDPEYLICVSYNTHNAIHYGDENLLAKDPIERTPGDTCPWSRKEIRHVN